VTLITPNFGVAIEPNLDNMFVIIFKKFGKYTTKTTEVMEWTLVDAASPLQVFL